MMAVASIPDVPPFTNGLMAFHQAGGSEVTDICGVDEVVDALIYLCVVKCKGVKIAAVPLLRGRAMSIL